MGKQTVAKSNQFRATVANEMRRFSTQHVREKYFVLFQHQEQMQLPENRCAK